MTTHTIVNQWRRRGAGQSLVVVQHQTAGCEVKQAEQVEPGG